MFFGCGIDSLRDLNLESSSISGPLPKSLGRLSSLKSLNLAANQFNGTLPESIGQLLKIRRDIPDCWKNWSLLRVVSLGNNNFKGNIPSSMGYLSQLKSLHLGNNSLNGEVPMALQRCTELVLIDLTENEFCGSTTSWMGKGLLNLISLDLRSNKFSGQIPSDICHLNSLQILDLANNNLSGEIPRCMGNLISMATKISNGGPISYSLFYGQLLEDAYVVTKGSEFQYDATLSPVTSMDLSSNNLSGEIPKELISLVGLRSPNLSGNFLTGMIPKKIGDMELLESLDFSRNQLSGGIPSSISNLTFLSYLTLSLNNLSGRIPSSTQLQSFDASCFIGPRRTGVDLCPLSCTILSLLASFTNSASKSDFSIINGTFINDLGSQTSWPGTDLNHNRFSGSLPRVSANLGELDLSRNWRYSRLLDELAVAASCNISDLRSLHLRNNSLNGKVPMALQKCTELVIIDLSQNEFCGSTSSWMGKGLQNLISLDLRLNKFSGQIPSDICHLNSLRILDLASNNLSGEKPRCMGNFTAMVTGISNNGGPIIYRIFGYTNSIGGVFELQKEVNYNTMPLCPLHKHGPFNQQFIRRDTKELTSLVGGRTLNLSGNCLAGMIPKKIGDMELLESLDFSRDQLSGEIPFCRSTIYQDGFHQAPSSKALMLLAS
ncbi:hypothetical protein RJ639_019103 [Escallonia herrerae]|uniref:Uncharacterized protein n=1 Tax=Escallonia herrerae TaxID=1293975 RepID=A0AA89AHW1_9ASTE|nr:hypothetical protein RJ639_019103 [Escallonia herrerae]